MSWTAAASHPEATLVLAKVVAISLSSNRVAGLSALKGLLQWQPQAKGGSPASCSELGLRTMSNVLSQLEGSQQRALVTTFLQVTASPWLLTRAHVAHTRVWLQAGLRG